MPSLTLKERAAPISEAAKPLSDELEQANFLEPSFELGLPAPLYSDAPKYASPTLKARTTLHGGRASLSTHGAGSSVDSTMGMSLNAR